MTSFKKSSIIDALKNFDKYMQSEKKNIDNLKKMIDLEESEVLRKEISIKIDNIIKYRDNEKKDEVKDEKNSTKINSKNLPNNNSNKEKNIPNTPIENSVIIDDIKSDFNSQYEKLINSIKTIKDTIDLVKMLASNNKLKTIFEIKNKNINSLYKKIVDLPNMNKENMDKIIEESNKFIKKEFKYDFINEVYKEIKISESTDIFVDVQLFFNSYKKYYDDLIKSINALLDQINNDELVLIEDKTLILNYRKFIQKKMNKYNDMMSNDKDDKDEKNTVKGKTKYVLPYTDILYSSIIQLIVIVDFLSYFYRAK